LCTHYGFHIKGLETAPSPILNKQSWFHIYLTPNQILPATLLIARPDESVRNPRQSLSGGDRPAKQTVGQVFNGPVYLSRLQKIDNVLRQELIAEGG
jgi:hypothetical protein